MFQLTLRNAESSAFRSLGAPGVGLKKPTGLYARGFAPRPAENAEARPHQGRPRPMRRAMKVQCNFPLNLSLQLSLPVQQKVHVSSIGHGQEHHILHQKWASLLRSKNLERDVFTSCYIVDIFLGISSPLDGGTWLVSGKCELRRNPCHPCHHDHFI